MAATRPAPPDARARPARKVAGVRTAKKRATARRTIAKTTTRKKTTAKTTATEKTAAGTAERPVRVAASPLPAAKARSGRASGAERDTLTAAAATNEPVAATPSADAVAISKRAYRDSAVRQRASADKRKASLARKLNVEAGPSAAVEGGAAQPAPITPIAPSRIRPPTPRSAVERLDDPPPATGVVLIDRVTDAIEREITLIEGIVGGVRIKPDRRTEAERRARTLASLARTLTELRRLRAGEEKKPPDDDSIPRDLDDFRRALSRRLEQMVADAAEFPAARDD